MAEKIIELKKVTKIYDGTAVVDNIDLYIRKGEFVTLLGPSGCGKTTTLRMIAGFEKPDNGEILLGGKDITSIPPYLRPINTVFQRYALFPHLNVYDNIAYGLKLKRVKNVYQDKNGPVMQSLLAAYRQETGDLSAPLAIGGGTYAKAMENIIAFGPVFPGEESREHQADEYIALDNIERLRRIYAQAFQNLLAL